jgi:hypothetical protein
MRRFATVKQEDAGMPNEPEELTLEEALTQLKKAKEVQAELKAQLEAAPPAVEPVVEPVVKSAADELREFAQMGLNTAEMMVAFGEMDPTLMPLIEEQLGAMQSLADGLEVAKGVGTLPEIFGEDEPDEMKLRTAAANVLKSMAGDAATLSMTMSDGEPTQAAKAMIGRFYANMQGINDVLGVTKSVKRFSASLRDVAERALALSSRAEEAGVDARTLRQARQLRDLVQGLVDQSSIAKSDTAPSMEDLRTVLSLSEQLDTIEDVIVAKEGDAPPAEDPPVEDPPAEDPPADPPVEDPPAEDPPAEDPPAEDPPAEDPPAEDPPAEDPPADPPAEDPPVDPPAEDPPAEDPPADPPAEDPPAEPPVEEPTELEKELAEIKKTAAVSAARVVQLEAYITKCRGEIPAPAVVVEAASKVELEKGLFPNNYNAPEERERWEQQRKR